MLETQLGSADRIREFLKEHGLKQKYVAEQTDIPATTLSRFLNHREVLSSAQYVRLMEFFEDYLTKFG